MANSSNQQFMIVDRTFLVSVVQDLRTLDVRGYESNEKLVGIVKDLQTILVTNVPISMSEAAEDTEQPTDNK